VQGCICQGPLPSSSMLLSCATSIKFFPISASTESSSPLRSIYEILVVCFAMTPPSPPVVVVVVVANPLRVGICCSLLMNGFWVVEEKKHNYYYGYEQKQSQSYFLHHESRLTMKSTHKIAQMKATGHASATNKRMSHSNAKIGFDAIVSLSPQHGGDR
jgi:hypothetical protein